MGRIALDSMAVSSTRIPVVRLAGAVTRADGKELDAALAKAASRPPVILDLADATRIDEEATSHLLRLVERLGRDRVCVVRPAGGALASLAGARLVGSAGEAGAALVEVVQHELANRQQVSAKPSAQGPSDFSGSDPGAAGFGDHRRDLGPLRG
jgi:anti-anti-sigma regulatory factor